MTLTLPCTRYQVGTHISVKTDHVLSIRGRRYGVGGIPEGASGRKVHEGPLVPGPWAYLYELATVLDNHGGTGAESTRMRAAGTEHVVAIGDAVCFDGCKYEIAATTRWTSEYGGTVYLKLVKESLEAILVVGAAIQLGQRSYTVERVEAHGADLRGARDGKYTLVQNVNNSSLWALVPSGRKPRSEWYRRRDDGSFDSIA